MAAARSARHGPSPYESAGGDGGLLRGRIEGRFVEGADRLRLDGEGKVREITVLARPLAGLPPS